MERALWKKLSGLPLHLEWGTSRHTHSSLKLFTKVFFYQSATCILKDAQTLSACKLNASSQDEHTLYPAPQQHPESPPLVLFTKPLPYWFSQDASDCEISGEPWWTWGSPVPISELSVLPVAPTPTSSQRAPSLSFSLIHSFSVHHPWSKLD